MNRQSNKRERSTVNKATTITIFVISDYIKNTRCIRNTPLFKTLSSFYEVQLDFSWCINVALTWTPPFHLSKFHKERDGGAMIKISRWRECPARS